MLKNYIKIALRNLAKRKAYAFINILGLAVGIACCLLISVYVLDELSYDRFHENGERIYRVDQTIGSVNRIKWAFTSNFHGPSMVDDFAEVESMTRVMWRRFLLSRDQQMAHNQTIAFVDSTFLDFFTFPVLEGDPETMFDAPNSVILTPELRDRLFQNGSVVGETIMLDNEEVLTVTGVIDVPSNTHFVANALIPYANARQRYWPSGLRFWGASMVATYIMLRPNTPMESVQAKLPAFTTRHRGEDSDEVLELHALTDIHLRPSTGDRQAVIEIVYLFSTIGLLVLLIACINYMNLATARAAERLKEVGMRKALGAHQGQLVSQFLGESVVLALVSVALALLFAELTLPFVNNLLGKELALGLLSHPLLLGLLIGFGLIVGVGAGLYPAFYLSRFEAVRVLKGKGSKAQGSLALRRTLVVAQFIVTIGLIAGTLLIQNQLAYVLNKDLGFNGEQVVAIRGGNADYQALEVLKQEVARMPQVKQVAMSSGQPGNLGWTANIFEVNAPEDTPNPLVTILLTDADYIPTMEMEIVAGRMFRRTDAVTEGNEAKMILNEATVQALGYASPEAIVGKRFNMNHIQNGEVIGVVRDFNFASLRESIEPLVMAYQPDWTSNLAVRIRPENISQTLQALETEWKSLLPEWPFVYSFVDDDFARQYAQDQTTAQLFSWFAGLAILIACLGLFGLAAFTAEQRTKEIGIRKVLGATVSELVGLLSRDIVILVLVAFIVSVPLVYIGINQWLSSFAYQAPLNIWIFLGAGLTTLLLALATISYQAIRAATANPIDALRYE